METKNSVVVRAAVATLCDKRTLDREDARKAMQDIMDGKASESQIAGFLISLKLVGETPEIVAACVEVLRDHAIECACGSVVDIVGTGGDGADTFNVSTTAGIVAAACGLRVAKHGNRASSSACGSADLLEAFGANVMLEPRDVQRIIDECNFCFIFSQAFHPAMKQVAATRKQLGVRTVFNILGPLINPARPEYTIVGVYSSSIGPLVAEALSYLGMKRVMVVCGEEGLDEISPAGKTNIWMVEGSHVTASSIHPADFGLSCHSLEAMKGGDAKHNVEILKRILNGETGPIFDWVTMNAGALLHVAGKAASFKEGVEIAREALLDGKAKKVFEKYIEASNKRSA